MFWLQDRFPDGQGTLKVELSPSKITLAVEEKTQIF